MFSTQIIVSPFVHIFDIISLFAAELKEPKIGISGKELTLPNNKNFGQDQLEVFAQGKLTLYHICQF